MVRQLSNSIGKRDGLPDALRVLADVFPRSHWEQHPNCGEMVQFWMQRHSMFGKLTGLLREDAQAMLEGELPREAFSPRLSLLDRHLLDEEDIVVPVVLSTGFRG